MLYTGKKKKGKHQILALDFFSNFVELVNIKKHYCFLQLANNIKKEKICLMFEKKIEKVRLGAQAPPFSVGRRPLQFVRMWMSSKYLSVKGR